jgi:sec-independent protein translocase protein TatC
MASHPEYNEDDLFAHTRMSLGDHIEELRGALWRAIKGFLVAMILGFFIAKPVLRFISRPVEEQLMVYHTQRMHERVAERKRQLEEGSKPLHELNQMQTVPAELSRADIVKAGVKDAQEAPEWIPVTIRFPPVLMGLAMAEGAQAVMKEPTLESLSITETFMVWVRVAIYCGFVLAAPWIFYQIWMFVAAGLYPHEKKYVHYFLPLSLTLFVAGAALCQFVVLPIGIHYLLQFNAWLNIEPDLRLSEWLSFAIWMPILFGVSFQTPLVMYFLERIGVFSVETYRGYRRIAIFIMFALSAVLSVSPDPFSMCAMAIPMCLLYELGILLCRMNPRKQIDLDVEEPEETVEV